MQATANESDRSDKSDPKQTELAALGSPNRSIILAGPSVVGKSSFIRRLRDDIRYNSPQPVTTNPEHLLNPEYNFLSVGEVQDLSVGGEPFVGTALGHSYGYPRLVLDDLVQSGPVCLHILAKLALDLRRHATSTPLLVFLRHPDERTFRRRLMSRYAERSELFTRRILHGLQEMEYMDSFDRVIEVADYEAAYRELRYLVCPDFAEDRSNP